MKTTHIVKQSQRVWFGAMKAACFATLVLVVTPHVWADDQDDQNSSPPAGVQRIVRDYDRDNDRGNGHYRDWIDRDPDLDVEIWTDNESGVYYTGENITIYFRADHDCYVSIYNIDTHGRVNLIYPYGRDDDPYIEGGRIYRIPGRHDDYELEINGPSGTENLQIVASRRPFPVPDWYDGSGLVCDRDRYEFIDYVTARYFGCRSGCLRATADVSFVVKDYDRYYYRPVYWDPWPTWGSYGSVYIDYWWGSSVYINGIYYGCAPLFIPRVCLGYNTITVYDPNGYCWEDRVVIRNGSNRFNNTIIRSRPEVQSRYKTVRAAGYRQPTRNGYPDVVVSGKIKPRTFVEPTVRSYDGARSGLQPGNDKTMRSATKGSGITAPTVRGFGTRAVSPSDGLVEPNTGSTSRVISKGANSKQRLEPFKTPQSDDAGASRNSQRESAQERSGPKTVRPRGIDTRSQVSGNGNDSPSDDNTTVGRRLSPDNDAPRATESGRSGVTRTGKRDAPAERTTSGIKKSDKSGATEKVKEGQEAKAPSNAPAAKASSAPKEAPAKSDGRSSGKSAQSRGGKKP